MTEDSSRHGELPDGSRDEPPIPPVADEPAWPAAAWPDTAVIEPAPTVVTDAETTRLGATPTTVDPTLPPVPPVAPSWTAPAPAPAAPTPAPGQAAPQWGAPAAPAPQWGAPSAPPAVPGPQYGAPGQYETPQYAAPQYGAPQYGGPQYGSPQYGSPQYGAPQYGGAQYGVPPGAGMPGVAGWGAVPMAPKPGVIPLRPLGLGEILDGAITYIRRDPKTVLGISAIIATITAAMQLLTLSLTFSSLDSLSTASTRTSSDDVAAFNDSVGTALAGQGAQLLQYVVSGILGVLATGLLTLVMGRAVLGQRVTLGEAWKGTSRRFWPLLGLTILISLAVGAVAVVGVLVSILVGWALSNASVGLGVFVGIVLGIASLLAALWLHVRLLLSPVALMLEGAGVGRSMSRSWRLVGGAWWRTFGIWLLAAIIAGIISGVLAVPFAIVGGIGSAINATNGSSGLGLTYFIATSLGTLVATTVVLPFSSGVTALLYIDRRIRREALDIELARAAGYRA